MEEFIIETSALSYSTSGMGFALWIQDDLAWAQGTHEYRPMGTAVIGVQGVFSPRDFERRRRAPSGLDPALVGLFASLGEMNDWLKNHASAKSRSQAFENKLKKLVNHGPPMF